MLMATTSTERRERWITMTVFAAIALLYVLFGHYGTDSNIDVLATNGPAWQLAVNGTLEVDFLEGKTPWLVEDKFGRTVSDRSPGLIATALPAYLLTRPKNFTNGPGTFTALILTLASVYLIFRLVRRELDFPAALIGACVLGLGTLTWSTSAQELWPHGPGQFWAALALTALAVERYWSAGLAYAAAITLRPVTAVAAAALGIAEAWRKRSIAPALKMAATSAIGVAVVVIYNRWLFGVINIGGGQGVPFDEGQLSRYDLGGYLSNLYEMFIGLPNGFLLWSPIVAVAAIGMAMVWRQIPGWARSGAIAGLVYLLVHAALNRASGGATMFYRYPLEAITLAAPALIIGGVHLWRRGPVTERVVAAAIIASVMVNLIRGFFITCYAFSPQALSCFHV